LIDRTTLAFAGALALMSLAPAHAQASRDDAGRGQPATLEADEMRGTPDGETTARGNAELRRGPLRIRADELGYRASDERARAVGNVRVERDGNVYTGRELQLQVPTFEGVFLDPTYFFSRTGAGGSATRFDFLGRDRAQAIDATYTSCPADGSGDPDWLLSAKTVKLDFERNEGIAESAVLRFLGVPILGAPVISFPLTDQRKSGWLPPDVNLDSKSGFEVSVPYYWNIAPNLDATFAPALLSRRGLALDSQLRYLAPGYRGQADLHLLPDDRAAERDRRALKLQHRHALPRGAGLRVDVTRVSDDAYWKDFPRAVDSLTPRLLTQDAQAWRDFVRPYGDARLYARVERWQVLRDDDPAALIVAPYQRAPQLGLRLSTRLANGLQFDAETEFNRFTLPTGEPDATRPQGDRVHALGAVSRPWRESWGWLVPRLALNAAAYRFDVTGAAGPERDSRTIPTFSIDGGLQFERSATWFGREARQTLEPRLLYVVTPFRDQTGLPNFDAAAKDFNFESIYTDNAFSGIDRVSDAHQLTAGVTTRLLDPATGAETVRLGVVQRYLFRTQQLTPEGQPFSQKLSDVLLLGSTNLVPRWHLDASVQYNPDIDRVVRSVLGARYSPGPFRTLSLRYRLARSLTEQVELAWQWPLYGRVRDPDEPRTRTSPLLRGLNGTGTQRCEGSWYSVGRINYSTRDSRVIDSLLGFEYDAGCWIGRVVAERLSTGRSEATTRLMLQLELVGLSRLGTNPLGALRDNIPGYRMLREEDDDAASLPPTR
jgi:LPS-assembly protein